MVQEVFGSCAVPSGAEADGPLQARTNSRKSCGTSSKRECWKTEERYPKKSKEEGLNQMIRRELSQQLVEGECEKAKPKKLRK